MRVLRVVLILLVALVIASPVMAQEKKKGRRGGGFDPLARLLEGLNLTDEQKAKVEDVKKEFAPKAAEIAKKRLVIFTDEQKKARAEAEKAAKEAGKSPAEIARAAREAVTLTDEQKSKLGEVGKEERELFTKRLEKIKEILTGDQKKQLKERLEAFKKGGKKKRD
jgi:Spy/CpxP family protein refolding chaperone